MFLLSGAACDNSFEPIAEEQADFFALFGYLDTDADTQFVRVSPLRKTLEPSAETIRVEVSSLHLATGAYVSWQDSLIQLDDGGPGLLFYAILPVAPGDAVQLEVRGSDGAVTQAATQVPSPIRLDSGPLGLDFNRKLSQRVTLLDQTTLPRDLRLRYEVVPPGERDPVSITFPVLNSGFTTARGLEVVVPLEADREEILRRLRVPQIDSTVVLQSIGLEIEELSMEWQAPEASANIQNGFGFLGSVAHYIVTWPLDPLDVKRLGYKTPD